MLALPWRKLCASIEQLSGAPEPAVTAWKWVTVCFSIKKTGNGKVMEKSGVEFVTSEA